VSAGSNKANIALPDDLKRRPLDTFEDVDCSLDLAAVSLKQYVAQTHQAHASKHELSEQYASDKPGSRALLCLLRTKHLENFGFLLNLHFLRALVHCMVGEDRVEELWKWMFIDYVPDYGFVVRQKRVWKGSILRALVEGQAYWTGGITVPLSTFFGAFMDRNDKPESRHIPLHQAGIWLIGQLSRSSEGVSSADFDRLMESMWWSTNRSKRHLDSASLMLVHPSGPDPSEALRFLQWATQEGKDEPYAQRVFATDSCQIVYFTFWFLIHTAQALDGCGQKAEARWVLDLGRENFPEMFVHHHTLKHLPEWLVSAWPRLKATDRQIAAGAQVDKDGYLVQDPRWREVWLAAPKRT